MLHHIVVAEGRRRVNGISIAPVLLIVSLFLSSNQLGGQSDVIQLEAYTVTATHERQKVYEVPPAVVVLEQDQLNRKSPSNLPDLLRGETGVFVQQTTPGQGAPMIRGLIGSSILILVDGMRLNSSFFRPAPNQYFALIDAQNVERIELIRGAASSLYGSDAMGGVIQVITPTPSYQTENWDFEGRTLLRVASADDSLTARLSLAGGKRGFAFGAGITFQDFGDLRAGGSTGDQKPSAYKVHAVDGKIFLVGETHDLLINLQYLKQPNTPRFDELVPGFGQTEPASAVFNFEPNSRLFVHGRYRLHPAIGFFDELTINFSFQQIDDDRRTRAFESTREIREFNQSQTTGITLQFTSNPDTRLKLIYGGEIYLDEVSSGRITHDLETGESVNSLSRFADGSAIDSYAAFFQAEFQASSRLTLTGGARVSIFDILIPEADRDVGIQRTIEDVTGDFRLSYEVTPSVRISANIGRGFRIPNVFDYSTLGPRPGNRFNIPNSNLRPESVLSIDAGIKIISGCRQVEAFIFKSGFEDKIEAVPTGSFTSDGRQVVQSLNLNNIDLWGIEFGFRYNYSDDLRLFGNLTYTRAEEEFPDGRQTAASRIPPLNGRAGFFFQAGDHLWIESFLRYALRQDRLSERDRLDPRINPQGTPDWATFNFRTGFDMNERLRIILSLENLFDKAYREHGSGLDAPGFNAALTIEKRF